MFDYVQICLNYECLLVNVHSGFRKRGCFRTNNEQTIVCSELAVDNKKTPSKLTRVRSRLGDGLSVNT
jgi:hypothetical protein